MKKQMKIEFDEMRGILNEWDPIGDVPEDEYDSYIMPILSILHKRGSRQEIEDYLLKMVEDMGLDQSNEEAKQVAERIFAWWSKKS